MSILHSDPGRPRRKRALARTGTDSGDGYASTGTKTSYRETETRSNTSSDEASIVISLDAELAWGLHDLYPLSEADEQRVSSARQAWSRLVDLFDEYGIPATWAVVGHLLVEDDEAIHAEHPLSESWFTTYHRDVAENPGRWNGIDLVQDVVDADAEHELGSHSFSHVVFPDATPDVAEVECRLARTVAERNGFEFTSFVFPRNEIAHRSVLSKTGFVCYRGRQPHRVPAIPGARGLTKLAGMLTNTVSPPVSVPRVDEYGLVEVPASLFVGGYRGRPWSSVATLAEDPAVRLAKLGIDEACRENGLFHMWFHPNDLTDASYVNRIDTILSYVATRRERGDVRIETMTDVARRVLEGNGG